MRPNRLARIQSADLRLHRLNHRRFWPVKPHIRPPSIYLDLVPIRPKSPSTIKSTGRPRWRKPRSRYSNSAPVERVDDAAIDRSHLSRMTFGDRSLEREVLQLFDRQAELLMERMRTSEPAAIATLAHTLKGSAVGIGAGRVARAAAATRTGREPARPANAACAIDELARSVDEARAQIAALLRAH